MFVCVVTAHLCVPTTHLFVELDGFRYVLCKRIRHVPDDTAWGPVGTLIKLKRWREDLTAVQVPLLDHPEQHSNYSGLGLIARVVERVHIIRLICCDLT